MTAAAAVQARLAHEARIARGRVAAWWAMAGALIATVAVFTFAPAGDAWRPIAAGLLIVAPLVAGLAGWWRGVTLARLEVSAARFEALHPADNLVITAEWLSRTGHAPLASAVADAARQRLDAVEPSRGRVIWRPAAGAVGLIVVGLAGLAVSERGGAPIATPAPTARSFAAEVAGITSIAVTVDGPAYLGGGRQALGDVTRVEVVAGSRITVRALARGDTLTLARDGGAPAQSELSGGAVEFAIDASAGGVWTLTPRAGDRAGPSRLLAVTVVPDAPPAVRLVVPGRDRRQAMPAADLPVRLEATDDHALAALRLRFTKVSGSGESFTFEDRDLPVRISRPQATAWVGDAVLPLATLGLEDGDVVVYRGVAADARPGAPAVESDAFLVEIGPLRDASTTGGGGEDVDPEDRQGISQQMVIVKTERLHARRAQLGDAARLEASQGLAIEQRMVRAEFVFLMGGEVQDEVEEAAHAHDLVEGRQENQGQAALLQATRAMSRAEARLTAGDTAGALVAEREALRLLTEAFDRRRFLLRPAPERARIDPSRRLQGTPPPVEPAARPVAPAVASAEIEALAALAAALRDAEADPAASLPALAARVRALGDDASAVAAAEALAAAHDDVSRRQALSAARRAVAVATGRQLRPAPAAPAPPAVSAAVAEALRRRGGR